MSSKDEQARSRPAWTRAALLDGSMHQAIARDAPWVKLLSPEEREHSLHETLAARPDPGAPAWLFAYGSLIWNPMVHFVEERVALVDGWRREFCLASSMGRGTQDAPGLILALEPGGSCLGVAFRLDEEALAAELRLVWGREMLSGAYVPRWVPVHEPAGQVFGWAIAFTMDKEHHSYAGGLEEEETVRRLATARGVVGTAAEYLFRTRDGLRAFGIRDELVERLAGRVAKELEEGPG